MARPRKEGLDYFPVNVDWDDSCKGIETEFKNDGTKWIIEFWKAAYRKRIGEIQLDGIHGVLFSKICNIEVDRHLKILELAQDIGFCYKTTDGFYTSNGIKKRISAVSKERADAVQRAKERKEAKERNKYKVKEITEKLPNNPRITPEKPDYSPEELNLLEINEVEQENFTRIRSIIYEKIGEAAYKTWFSETRFCYVEEKIIIYVKNTFTMEYIVEKYYQSLKTLMEESGLNHELVVEVIKK
jgi:hypothetical protein